MGWIGYMCDCADILLHARRFRGNRDLAFTWLRPLVETSIMLHWVGHDEERAWRVVNTQYRAVRRRERNVRGTIFDRARAPEPPLKTPKGVPSVTDMAREVGEMEMSVFLLESERLHAGAVNASEYVHMIELGDDAIIQLRRPVPGKARESGVLAVCLQQLIKAGVLLSQRFELGLEHDLEEIGRRVGVSLRSNATATDEWKRLFDAPS